jgi:hypothetical protein
MYGFQDCIQVARAEAATLEVTAEKGNKILQQELERGRVSS